MPKMSPNPEVPRAVDRSSAARAAWALVYLRAHGPVMLGFSSPCTLAARYGEVVNARKAAAQAQTVFGKSFPAATEHEKWSTRSLD